MAGGAGADGRKGLLDWALLGAAPTRPATPYMALCTAAPGSGAVSSYEWQAATYSRQVCSFGAAVTLAGGSATASNTAAISFVSPRSNATISGIIISDTSLKLNGRNLFFVPLATAMSVGSNDTAVVNAGALVITLA